MWIEKVPNGYIAWPDSDATGIILALAFFGFLFFDDLKSCGETKSEITKQPSKISAVQQPTKNSCVEMKVNGNIRLSMRTVDDRNIYKIVKKGTKFCNYKKIGNWIEITLDLQQMYIHNSLVQFKN